MLFVEGGDRAFNLSYNLRACCVVSSILACCCSCCQHSRQRQAGRGMEERRDRSGSPMARNSDINDPNHPPPAPWSLKRSVEASSTSAGSNNSSSNRAAFIGPRPMPDGNRTRGHGKQPNGRSVGLSHSSSIHLLLRERQICGRGGRFVAREGAGVWSPDPLHRALGSNPHFLRRMQRSGELKGHNGCVNTVSCTPDGKYWITGSDDMKIMVRGV